MSDFTTAAARVAAWIESYRASLDSLPVLSRVAPGELADSLPAAAPDRPEPLDALLADLDRYIVPGLTHWNHPGFMAYFCSSSSDPGVLAEFVAAAFNVNAMLWRTSPAATELEERMVAWTRDFVGLPPCFSGVIQDTASTGLFVALAAARHRAYPEARASGLAGRNAPVGRVYGSRLAHSSLDKAVIAAGLGHDNLVRVPFDERYAMRPDALDRALREDREAGRRPVMVCATIGTTSCASVDPTSAIADVCADHGVWLHVDAAYAGPAASLPELRPRFEGWERADSLIVNPHKWMSVPLDCSLLLARDLDGFRASLALTPEYLASESGGTNLMDVGLALGRRFRALKLWFVFRRTGASGLREMIRGHCELAREFAERVEGHSRLALAAPVSFGTVCFRAVSPPGQAEEEWNRRLLAAVNRDGRVFLSHTELDGRHTIRLVVGSVHTGPSHVDAAWDSVTSALAGLTRGLTRPAGDAKYEEVRRPQPGRRPERTKRMLDVGDAAPDFTLESDSGESVALEELRGRRVVLYFYPKDDTSGCTKEACGFRDEREAFRAQDVTVLGVSPDGVASHAKFRDKYELNFPLLADPDHAVAEAYGAWGKKNMYGREYEGVLRSTFVIGPDGRIEKIYRKVKPAEHATEILEDLES